MKRLFVVLFLLITIFLINGVEAKSLKKGEVYSLLNWTESMEVISDSELEIMEGGDIILAKYDFKGDKLRVVINFMGRKMVQYYLITPKGLKDEKTGQIYYSKAGLKAELVEAERKEEKRLTYTNNGNGTITQGTGLMWQKEDDNRAMKWEEAISYCEGLSLGGYTDWRLPNIEELQSIVDRKWFPTIDLTYLNTKTSYYWSSTTSAYHSSNAWLVSFAYGDFGINNKSMYYYVRCVRGGQ